MTQASLSQIGKILGGKDHTTVMHGVEKMDKEIVDKSEVSHTIDIITKKINPQSST